MSLSFALPWKKRGRANKAAVSGSDERLGASAGCVVSLEDAGVPSRMAAISGPTAAHGPDAPVWLSVEDAIDLELEWPGVFSYHLAVWPGVINLDISTGLRISDAIDQALMLDDVEGSATHPSSDL